MLLLVSGRPHGAMAILFDLDGVFYQGDTAIAGAADVASWVRARAIPHLFLTNTTSRPRSLLLQKLAAYGIETDADGVLGGRAGPGGILRPGP